MRKQRFWTGVVIGGAMLATVTSCVPVAAPRAMARVTAPERAVVDARPLLARMDLTVGAADAPPIAGPVAAAIAAAPPFLAATRSADDAARAIDCLTAAVYYEARSEPADGQRAVAQVVLNRVRDRAYPNSVCGVVYQGSNRATGCQFSFTCDGSMRRPREAAAWDRSRIVAQGALGGSVYTPIGSATSFHTTAISPWWAPSLVRIGTVGSHIFYRWGDALERALGFRQSYAGIEPGTAAAATGERLASDDGVTIHRAGALVEGGVTIHRGGDDAGPAVAAAPVSATRLAGGVRVHVGRQAPAGAAAAGVQAVVSEEIDGL